MLINSDKEKIPANPWGRFAVSDKTWWIIYVFAQYIILVGCCLTISGYFFGADHPFFTIAG